MLSVQSRSGRGLGWVLLTELTRLLSHRNGPLRLLFTDEASCCCANLSVESMLEQTELRAEDASEPLLKTALTCRIASARVAGIETLTWSTKIISAIVESPVKTDKPTKTGLELSGTLTMRHEIALLMSPVVSISRRRISGILELKRLYGIGLTEVDEHLDASDDIAPERPESQRKRNNDRKLRNFRRGVVRDQIVWTRQWL